MLNFIAHIDENVDSEYLDHMMHGEHWADYGSMGFVWTLVALGVVVLVAVLLFSFFNDPSKNDEVLEDALKIAKTRYAKGDITKKQFEVIKKDIK